jgi:hypothetical protein
MVKHVVAKIRNQVATLRKRAPVYATQSPLGEELEQLELYIIELATDPKKIPRDVLGPILEEMLVDFSEEIRDVNEPNYFAKMESATKSSDSAAVQALVQIQLDAISEAKSRIGERLVPPSQIDWDDLWKNSGAS